MPAQTQILLKRYERPYFRLLATVLVWLTPICLVAQIKNDGPAAIVIAYKTSADKRAAFRSHMETAGVRQFAQWKKEGVFSRCRIYFGTYADTGADSFDMMVILDFPSFSASARWREIEKRMPGGLSREALTLGWPDRTSLVYPVGDGEATKRDPTKTASVIGTYRIQVDPQAYEKYAKGYIEPQFKGWIVDGALSAYSMYQRQPYQNLSEQPWSFLIVLEYRDLKALAESNLVKERVRQNLMRDPVWKAFSESKEEMRKANGFVFVDALLASP
jgi:hypothetical protein